MGWDYSDAWVTKRDVINELAKDYTGHDLDGNKTSELKLLAKAIKGNCLWMVFEVKIEKTGEVSRFIDLALLGKTKVCGLPSWGYKRMEESMHPYYYSCPLAFLALVPDGSQTACEKWREEVRAYHAAKASFGKVEVGAVFALKSNTWGMKQATIISVRPLRANYDRLGLAFRLTRRALDHRIS